MWFQSLPEGDVAVGYWEGDDPRAALKVFASSEDPLDEWLKKRGREAYQFEPDQPLSISSLPPPWLLQCAQLSRGDTTLPVKVHEPGKLFRMSAYFQRFSKTPGQ